MEAWSTMPSIYMDSFTCFFPRVDKCPPLQAQENMCIFVSAPCHWNRYCAGRSVSVSKSYCRQCSVTECKADWCNGPPMMPAMTSSSGDHVIVAIAVLIDAILIGHLILLLPMPLLYH